MKVETPNEKQEQKTIKRRKRKVRIKNTLLPELLFSIWLVHLIHKVEINGMHICLFVCSPIAREGINRLETGPLHIHCNGEERGPNIETVMV
jgi:hypothetical protein